MKGQIHRTLLPESIVILASVYGAGRSIWIPHSTAHAERFEVLLGMPETKKLVDAFGGNPVYLPGLPKGDGKPRGPTLPEVERLSETMSAAKIAGLYGCSTRTIYNKRERIRQLQSARTKT